MRSGLCAIFCLFFLLAGGRAEPLVSLEYPSDRVRDEGQILPVVSKTILADYLDTISRTQQMEIYVVILQDKALQEAVRLCDQWQREWIPRGLGGVFAYSVPDKKYCFTPTPETVATVGSEKLQELFREAVQNPPMLESLDVIISVPIMRMVAKVGQERLRANGGKAEEDKSQVARWQVIAGMAGALALLGWVMCFSKVLQKINWGGEKLNIPPPGMAYRNPPRRSRSGRRSRDESGEGVGEERSSRKDRF